MVCAYNIQGKGWQDYKSYIDYLTGYYLLEKSANPSLKNYTRRYRQFLMQVFSRDSILQLIPNTGILPLLEYSSDGDPDNRLSSLILALRMIFINIPAGTDAPELRMLSETLAKQAQLTYNNLVRNRDIIQTSSCPPLFSPQDWQENGSFYDGLSICHRLYYEDRDNDKNVDAAESGQCKKILFNLWQAKSDRGYHGNLVTASHLP